MTDPSEETVERVARVIDPWAWDELNAAAPAAPLRRQISLEKARAAIEAMPT